MPNVTPINEMVSRCERLRGEGRLEESETLCRRILVQAVAHAGLLFQSAATAFSAVQPQLALDRFRRVKAIIPGATAIHYNIGVCERRLGRHGRAERNLKNALLLDPTALGSLESLALSQSASRNGDGGMTSARRQMILRPISPRAFSTLGYVAWKADQLEIAERALKISLLLDPSAREADKNLGNVLADSDRYAKAIRRYRRLLRLEPRDQALCGNLGVALVATGNWREASRAYAKYARLAHGRPVNQAAKDPFPELPVVPSAPGSQSTAWHRLKFDAQQLKYILDLGLIPTDFERELEAYQFIIEGLNDQNREAISFTLSKSEMDSISRYHDRLINLSNTDWNMSREGQPTVNRVALGSKTDWSEAAASYKRSEPAVMVIDDFLNPRALSALRKFCLESTIWFELKGAGYLGAYFREGFNDPLLLAIAEELSEKMPEVFAGHPLRMIWAYSYEQSMVGINPHADFAKINVNFWITPDSANLDPETGGLLIYRRPAPETWGFDKYNAAPGLEIMNFLGDDALNPIRIPHRQNRAVIFDSRLFHETDRLNFREGLENRRINITMLFGNQ